MFFNTVDEVAAATLLFTFPQSEGSLVSAVPVAHSPSVSLLLVAAYEQFLLKQSSCRLYFPHTFTVEKFKS